MYVRLEQTRKNSSQFNDLIFHSHTPAVAGEWNTCNGQLPTFRCDSQRRITNTWETTRVVSGFSLKLAVLCKTIPHQYEIKPIVSCFRNCVSFRCFLLRQFSRKRNFNTSFGKLSINGEHSFLSRKHNQTLFPASDTYLLFWTDSCHESTFFFIREKKPGF